MSRTFGVFGELSVSADFVPAFHSGLLSIAASSTGTLDTITPPSGKRCSIDLMYGTVDIADITITCGGVTCIDGLILSSFTSSGSDIGEFAIGNPRGSTTSFGSTLVSIKTKSADDVIIISTATSTAGIIYYSYSYEA